MPSSARGTLFTKSPGAAQTKIREHLKTTAKDHLYKTPPTRGVADDPGASLTISGPAPATLAVSGGPAEPPPAPSSGLTPIMTVEEFNNGDYVEPGDVILMTRLGSFFAWLVRFFDQSNFAHAAMVFQTPRNTEGIDKVFLIETSMAGVEIVSLSQFLAPTNVYADTGLPPDFVVGVRRLESEWAEPPHRRMAASRMLHFIENEHYNFRLLAALASQKTRGIYFKIRDSLRGRAPAIGDFLRKNGRWMPTQFICSGFVQYAFIDMVRTGYQRGLITSDQAEKAMDDVIFCPDMSMQNEIEELMACTPKFLAHTDKLAWKYLIHKGDVFHVSTAEEVDTFFKETLPKRRAEQLQA